jgi:putative tryptophan/tyrosine transport system substrate-binding protein
MRTGMRHEAAGNSKKKSMTSKIFSWVPATLLLATVSIAEAQQPVKIPKLGCYISGATGFGPREEAFRQGLRDLGYVEGKTIFTEWRFAAGQEDRATAMLEELLRVNVDIIVTDGNRSTSAAKNATSTIPIVMAVSGDPVGAGLVKTLARRVETSPDLLSCRQSLAASGWSSLKKLCPRSHASLSY